MKSSDLQAFSSTFLEEPKEPRPKKIKIDRSNLSLEDEPQVQLQRLYYADQKSSKQPLCFSEVLWNVHQKDLELQDGNVTNLKTSTRPYMHFKLCMNANLQPRLLGNIPFYEKCSLENRGSSVIGDVCAELNEHNILVTNPGSWALHAKEREKSIESSSSWSELAIVNPVFNDIWAESFITRTESFKDMPEFQSNENGAVYPQVHEISRPRAQYQVLKPVTIVDTSNRKIPPLCFPARSFMKGSKSDVEFLFYKNLNGDGNILPFPKHTRCPANNNFRRKREFQNLYKPYSRKCERVINPKLVKCAAFESLWQGKREYNCSTAAERNDTSIFSQRTVFNIHLKEVSKGSSTKECHRFSKDTVEGDNTFSVDGNEKEKTARQHVLYNNQMLQDNNIHSSTVWNTSLSNAKKMYYLTAYLRSLNTLSSFPNMFEKLNIKHSSLQLMVTMVTCTQKEKKVFKENSVFLLENFKTLHFVLRANQKCIAKRFRNSINFVKERKHVPRYLETYSTAVMDKKISCNCEDVQKTHCRSVVTKVHLSLFETYEKVPLSDDEELDQISFTSKAIFNYENNEKYIKGCTASASRITYNAHDSLAYVLPKLLFNAIPNCNYLLQESKSKNSHYPDNVSTNSQVLKHRINRMPFPINGPNSRNIFSFTSVIFYDLFTDQYTTARVKTWHSKVVLFGNRRKQNNSIFDKMKGVLHVQPICKTGVSNSLKHLKKVKNMNVLLQKGILLSGIHGSDLVVCAKQNTEDVREIEKEAVVVPAYTSKRNQHQNLILPYFQNESANIIGSKDRLTEFSCAMKQEHFEDMMEKHSSSEFKNKYEFEMKKQFDLVLEELSVFNDISKENKNPLCKQKDVQENSLELSYFDSKLHEDSKNIYENKENMTFSTCGNTLSYTTVVNQDKKRQISFKDTGLNNCGEQEVPHEDCSSRILDEELFYPTPEERIDSGYKQPLPWNPAFVSHSFMKERSYILQGERGNCFDDRVIRVQPLKTCHGPLRVGLSRKAKPKQLHPYLK